MTAWLCSSPSCLLLISNFHNQSYLKPRSLTGVQVNLSVELLNLVSLLNGKILKRLCPSPDIDLDSTDKRCTFYKSVFFAQGQHTQFYSLVKQDSFLTCDRYRLQVRPKEKVKAIFVWGHYNLPILRMEVFRFLYFHNRWLFMLMNSPVTSKFSRYITRTSSLYGLKVCSLF